MKKTTLKLFPNYSKTSKRTNQTPIYLRIYHNSVKVERNTGAILKPNNIWNENLRGIEGNIKDTKKLNKIVDKFDDFTLIHQFDLKYYTPKQILNYIFEENNIEDDKTIVVFARNYIDEYIVNSADLSKGTKGNYEKTFRHFKTFTELNSISKMPLHLFDYSWASKFHSYLLNPKFDEETKALIKKPMLKVSATGHIKKLRPIFNKAVDLEIINKNPFKAIPNTTKSNPRTIINFEQMKRIFNTDLSHNPTLEVYKDIFNFTIMTGLSYQDIMLLDENTVFNMGKGLFLSTRRIKTKKITEMYLPEKAVEILNKFKGNNQCKATSRLIPYRYNQTLNQYLKILATNCNINLNLFHYHARYCFRALIRESQITEPLERKLLMGHSSSADIDAIYHKVTYEHLYKAKLKIDKYVKRNLIDQL
jgi:integrase